MHVGESLCMWSKNPVGIPKTACESMTMGLLGLAVNTQSPQPKRSETPSLSHPDQIIVYK
jgi:hypothetical protein